MSESLESLRHAVQTQLQSILSLPKRKKLQALADIFPFQQCFSIKGVQGIAGLLSFKPKEPKSTPTIPTPIEPLTIRGKKKLKKERQLNRTLDKNQGGVAPGRATHPKDAGETGIASQVTRTGQPRFPAIVFKVSCDVNLCIEHERDILLALNSIRNWCPHYVGCLADFTVHLSPEFIDVERQHSDSESDSEEERELQAKLGKLSIWTNDEESIPSSMLLLEYIGPHSIHHMCRYGSMQQSLAQIVMTLAGLEMAQQQLRFVHYDMHLDNILLKECNEHLVFVYQFENPNDFLIMPTLGHYPVMIDMGSSFSQTLVGTAVKTSVSFYSSGLQPTVFDPLNDVHHFLFRCIDRLELFHPRWRDVGTKLMHIFRHLPLWRYKGWKKLPTNLVKNVIKKLYELHPDMADNDFWNEYTYEIMDILAIATTIHWKQLDQYRSNPQLLNQDLTEAIRYFSDQLILLDDFDDFKSDDDILMVIRELTSLSRRIVSSERINKEQESQFRHHIGQMIGTKLPLKFNVAEMTHCISRLGAIFSHLFALHLNDNLTAIDLAYQQIPIKRPYDAIQFLLKMVPCRYRLSEHTVFRVFDARERKTYDISATQLFPNGPVKQEFTTRFRKELHQRINHYKEKMF